MKRTLSREIDLRHLAHAARLAIRGHGHVEPNPMVGCVITQDDAVVGWGYHKRFGEPHAEVEALARAGAHARGSTAYITLEPCSHYGKTPPCSQALIDAGVARVVIAQAEPHPEHRGGAALLGQAGVEVVLEDGCPLANNVSAPFCHRVETGLPWVIAKWAQTIDGRIATRNRESKWISGQRSRRMVHRERGRVDAILTGIGTVLADDPMLTARDVRVRRLARRVVIDPKLQTPLEARLVTTADVPTSIACYESIAAAETDRVEQFLAAGVELIPIPFASGADREEHLLLRPILLHLVQTHDVTTVLTECGSGLLGRLFDQNLVNETWVFTAPMILGDERATASVRGLLPRPLAEVQRVELKTVRRRGDDILAHYSSG